MKKYLLLFYLTGIIGLIRTVPLYAQTDEMASADTNMVRGTVKDGVDGGPLPGANVYIKGTTTGTVTDFNGNYKIKVPKGITLVFSFIGYAKTEIVVKKGQHDVTLSPEVNSTDEVVVVGYGQQKMKEATGVISSVHAADIANRPMPTFDAALQGRAPGLQIVSSSGVPGAATRVRIRGQGSVNGSSDPLYVIDGIVVDTRDRSASDGGVDAINQNPLATIPPEDIERIDVLKDASSTGIYGARGANGVIVITTKRGKSGKTRFSANLYTGVTEATHKISLTNGDQYLALLKEAYNNDLAAYRDYAKNPGKYAVQPSKPSIQQTGNMDVDTSGKTNANTDWVSQSLRPGRIQSYDISASGGNDKTQFYLGLGYYQNQGILKGGNYERFNGRINIDNRPNDFLKVGASVGLTYVSNKTVPTSYNGGIGASQSNALPIFPVYYTKDRNGNDSGYNGTQVGSTYNNPVAQLEDNYYSNSFRNLTTLYSDAQILPSLSLHLEGSLDLTNYMEDYYYSSINRYYNRNPLAAAKERRVLSFNLITNNYLTFNKDFGDHGINIVAGTSYQKYTQRDIGYYPASGAVGFTDPTYSFSTGNMGWFPGTAPSGNQTGSAVGGFNDQDFYNYNSFFGRFNYAYKKRYLAQVNTVTNGSSKFSKGNQYGFFPSGSVGWVISEEPFMKKYSFVTFLKFKTGFGITGNANIPNFQYADNTYYSSTGYLGNKAQGTTQFANGKLGWERALMYDAGFDYGFLDGRITGNIGYFVKYSSRLLAQQPIQTSAAGIATILVNTDNVLVRNQGLEANISVKAIDRAFKWTIDYNTTFLQNKVLDVGGVPPDNFSNTPGDARIVQGQPMSVSYIAKSAGVDPETGNPLIYDLNGNKIVATQATVYANRQPLGNPFPTNYGGINNNFEFMGVDFSFFFTYSYGNTIYDDGAKFQNGNKIYFNQRTSVLDRWQKPGDNASIAKLSTTDRSWLNTDQWLYDGSFIRLRTVQIGYTLPAELCKKYFVSNLRIYVMANNLALWTKYPGWDPEVVRAAGKGDGAYQSNNISFNSPYLATPQARTYQVGLTVTF